MTSEAHVSDRPLLRWRADAGRWAEWRLEDDAAGGGKLSGVTVASYNVFMEE
jgi:hypothetical protein